MTPRQWARVLAAGAGAIPSRSEPAGNALALVLDAMAREAEQIAGEEDADAAADG